MTNKTFELKLTANYVSENNDIETLSVYLKNNNEWEALDLTIKSPGFLLFINGLFSCQHLYMRINCAERGIVLTSTVGLLKIETNDLWQIQKAEVLFDTAIKAGKISDDDYQYISGRMHHCPVSSNLPPSLPLKNHLKFH